MTDTSIHDAKWKTSGRYEAMFYSEEGCIGQGLPLEYMIRKMIRLNDKVFHLLSFIASEGYWEEAIAYLKEHMDEEAPFEII